MHVVLCIFEVVFARLALSGYVVNIASGHFIKGVSVVDFQVQRPGIGDSIALDMFLGKIRTEANDMNCRLLVKFLLETSFPFISICEEISSQPEQEPLFY